MHLSRGRSGALPMLKDTFALPTATKPLFQDEGAPCCHSRQPGRPGAAHPSCWAAGARALSAADPPAWPTEPLCTAGITPQQHSSACICIYARVCLRKLKFLPYTTTQKLRFLYKQTHCDGGQNQRDCVCSKLFSMCKETPRLRARQRKNAQHASLAHAVGDCTACH